MQNEEKTTELRRKKHKDHLDYFYGDYWNIFIDADEKCYLEFDKGHFATDFVVREITRVEYDSLKNDKTLFKSISNKLV